MSTKLESKLQEIETRAERAANWRSDDFGHDTDRLARASMMELDHFAENTIPKLLALISKLIEQRDSETHSAWDGKSHYLKVVEEYNAELLSILEPRKDG